MSDAVLPYAGTSGWSGSETSRQRALTADRDGTTSKRQKAVIDFVASRGYEGVTWRDVAAFLDVHHGTASGVLSVLHKSGHIDRLLETRNRCAVYVHYLYRDGRATAPQGRTRRPHTCPNCGVMS